MGARRGLKSLSTMSQLSGAGGSLEAAVELRCTGHRRLLVDSCPACDFRLAAGRRDGRAAPPYLARVPDTRCAETNPGLAVAAVPASAAANR